jgi:hypothetical protein
MDKDTIFRNLVKDLKIIKQQIEKNSLIYNRTLRNYNQIAKHVYFTPSSKKNKDLLISDIHHTKVCERHDKDCFNNIITYIIGKNKKIKNKSNSNEKELESNSKEIYPNKIYPSENS